MSFVWFQWRPQAIVFEIVTDKKFHMIIMLFIGLNMLTMTLDHYQQSETFSTVLDYLNMIFIVIFSSECLLKMFALRYHYFVEPWNLFDFVVVNFSILSKYNSFEILISNFLQIHSCSPFVSRFGTQWYYRKIFCVADSTESGESSESRSSVTSRERCKGYQDVIVRVGHVTASSVQHLFVALPRHVYLCYLWNVVLYARQGQRWPWWRVQLQDLRAEYDPAVPGLLACVVTYYGHFLSVHILH